MFGFHWDFLGKSFLIKIWKSCKIAASTMSAAIRPSESVDSATTANSASSSGPQFRDLQHQQKLVSQLQRMNAEERSLRSKIIDLKEELHEHQLTLTYLETFDQTRLAFHTIGPTLVKKPVKEIVPNVAKTRDNLAKTIEELEKECRRRMEEKQIFINKYGPELQRYSGGGGASGSGDGGGPS